MILEFDKLILSNEIEIKKEGILKDQGNPITKNEILNLLIMEKSMCKIIYEKYEDYKIKKGKASGFFCQIDNFPIKYALFTNNHVLNKENTNLGNIINIEFLKDSLYIEKKIEVDGKRRIYANKELDYTCIELFETDGIKNYFKIDPILFTNKKKYIENTDIFVLQYPEGNELSFSYGKIRLTKYNNIVHNASTKEGSSGSPIIRRCKENYIIGLHYGGMKKKENINYSYNLASIFDSILNDINKPNEINCLYKVENHENEIQLLHEYNLENYWNNEDYKKLYIETKDLNKNFYEENLELYINNKKIKFNYKYKVNKIEEIKVKFKFKKKLTNSCFMFFNCSSLNSIDLSSFNSSNVTKMCCMFTGCTSLNSINLSSFNTGNVKDMSNMFSFCRSLKSINLYSFNTINVKDMSYMFQECSSLNSIDLSTFNTINVTNMKCMFCSCSSLNSIDFSSFNTINVIYMKGMFENCISLNKINISSFNTCKVTNMRRMFKGCSSLNLIDLSSFDTTNVIDMNKMFYKCSSLNKIDLSSFNINNATNISYIFKGCKFLTKDNIKSNDNKILNQINFI